MHSLHKNTNMYNLFKVSHSQITFVMLSENNGNILLLVFKNRNELTCLKSMFFDIIKYLDRLSNLKALI